MPGLSLGLGLGLSRSQGGGFSLAAFMASQADGFWYDFASTDRLFQENVGPTPADEPNEVIGLALSQRLWNGQSLAAYLAVQPELVTDPSFNNSVAWTPQTGWSVTGGQAVASSVAAFGLLNQSLTVPAGRLCRMEIVVSSVSAGGIRLRLMGGAEHTAATRTAPGTYVEYLIAGGNTTVALQAGGSGFTGTVDSISVKEVSRYPATQATAGSRPAFQTTGAEFDGTDDNLLTGYVAGAGANFIVAKVTVPGSISANPAFLGAADAGPTNRCHMGADSTTGQLRIGLGSQLATVGTVDRRGQTVVFGMSWNGTTVRLYDGGLLIEGAQSGSSTTVTPFRLGSINTAGVASGGRWPGSLGDAVAGREFLTLERFNQIASQL